MTASDPPRAPQTSAKPTEREVWCPLCGQARITQREISPGVFRPWGCAACLGRPLTPDAGGRIVQANDNPVAPTRPVSAPQTWVVFSALQEVRCGGWREPKHAERRPCRGFLGTVNPGSLVRLRMRDPQFRVTSTDPGGCVQICHRCGWRFELQTARA